MPHCEHHDCPFTPDFSRSLTDALAEIKAEQKSIRKELLGNGQPGRIQLIEADVKSQGEQIRAQNEQISKAGWKIVACILVAVLSFAASVAAFSVTHPQEKPTPYIQQSK